MQRVLAERALPSGVFGPRDFAPFLRLASARALLTGAAARGDRAVGLGARPEPRSDRAILEFDMEDTFGWGGKIGRAQDSEALHGTHHSTRS